MIQFAWRLGGWCIRSTAPLQAGVPVIVHKKGGAQVESVPGLLLFKSKSFYIYEIQEDVYLSEFDLVPELVEEGDR